jgi:hypothetical protein
MANMNLRANIQENGQNRPTVKSPVRANIQENGQNRPTVKSPGPCLVRCEICENLLYNCKSKIRRT